MPNQSSDLTLATLTANNMKLAAVAVDTLLAYLLDCAKTANSEKVMSLLLSQNFSLNSWITNLSCAMPDDQTLSSQIQALHDLHYQQAATLGMQHPEEIAKNPLLQAIQAKIGELKQLQQKKGEFKRKVEQLQDISALLRDWANTAKTLQTDPSNTFYQNELAAVRKRVEKSINSTLMKRTTTAAAQTANALLETHAKTYAEIAEDFARNLRVFNETVQPTELLAAYEKATTAIQSLQNEFNTNEISLISAKLNALEKTLQEHLPMLTLLQKQMHLLEAIPSRERFCLAKSYIASTQLVAILTGPLSQSQRERHSSLIQNAIHPEQAKSLSNILMAKSAYENLKKQLQDHLIEKSNLAPQPIIPLERNQQSWGQRITAFFQRLSYRFLSFLKLLRTPKAGQNTETVMAQLGITPEQSEETRQQRAQAMENNLRLLHDIEKQLQAIAVKPSKDALAKVKQQYQLVIQQPQPEEFQEKIDLIADRLAALEKFDLTIQPSTIKHASTMGQKKNPPSHTI